MGLGYEGYEVQCYGLLGISRIGSQQGEVASGLDVKLEIQEIGRKHKGELNVDS